jgi:phosphocarrier protein FPr
MASHTFQGTGASPGIGEGRALVYRRHEGTLPSGQCASGCVSWSQQGTLPPTERGAELSRFRSALDAAGAELAALSADVWTRLGEAAAAVFEAQSLFLQDPSLTGPVEDSILSSGTAAPSAVMRVFDAAAADLESMSDAYLAARAADLRDVQARVLRLLRGSDTSQPEVLDRDTVVIAHDLTPSDTVALPLDLVRGVVLAGGTPTAHAAILARGLGLPLVVGAGAGILGIAPGQTVVVDGTAGTVLVEPGAEERATLPTGARSGDAASTREDVRGPVLTRDGHHVEIFANASSPAEARLAASNGAEGIGLLRTEFLLAALARDGSDAAPTEEALTDAYAGVFEAAGGIPVTVRAMDAGGDKPLPFLHFGEEANPFLGWRGIRILLDEPDLFAAQTGAALRAAAQTGTDLRLMIPMVCTLDEFIRARAIVEQVAADIALPHPLKFGVMIETPAAALNAAALAQEADFFSIGTNDLVQYTLACDRGNARVAALCRPEHPAVLRLVDMTVRAAHAAGKPVGVCGEVAGDPLYVPLLLGLGIDELSAGPARLPDLRRTVRGLDRQHAAALGARALLCATADEVRTLL